MAGSRGVKRPSTGETAEGSKSNDKVVVCVR
jgi:hypothetical protein